MTLRTIVNTHLHFDHIQGNAGLAAATGALILASSRDGFPLDTELAEVDMLPVPGLQLRALGRGRTRLARRDQPGPGHARAQSGQPVFVFFRTWARCSPGDLLFTARLGGPIFRAVPNGICLRSVRTKIFTLPAETVVYPGHGPQTTVGVEALNNPFFTEFVR